MGVGGGGRLYRVDDGRETEGFGRGMAREKEFTRSFYTPVERMSVIVKPMGCKCLSFFFYKKKKKNK